MVRAVNPRDHAGGPGLYRKRQGGGGNMWLQVKALDNSLRGNSYTRHHRIYSYCISFSDLNQ